MGNLILKMKIAFYAALVAVASAAACNDSLQAKFWDDAKCTKANAALTRAHGKPPAEMMKFADGKCHGQGKQSMKITCGPNAMNMQMWQNGTCSGKAAQGQAIPFDTCMPGGPKDTYVTVHHK